MIKSVLSCIYAAVHSLKTALLLLLFLPLFISCYDSIDLPNNNDIIETDTARCLTLVYIMAENSLNDFAYADIKEMESAASLIPEDCRMVAFVDDCRMPRICRFYDDNGVATCDTVYKFTDDFCSSDSSNLRLVLNKVLDMYPAKSMNLVMWSHGSGWIRGTKAKAPMLRSIGVDNGQNSYSNSSTDVIEIEELAAVINSLPIDVQMLMFDACFMQTAETAYALRNSAEWIVASPAEIPGNGAPYHLLMEPFFSMQFNVEDVINAYLSAYRNNSAGVLLSAVRCDAMQKLADCTKNIIPDYFYFGSEQLNNALFSYLPGGYCSYTVPVYPDYLDMNALMKSRLSNQDYDEWSRALAETVPYSVASNSWYSALHCCFFSVDRTVYSGISMFVPMDEDWYSTYNESFKTTEWYKASGWCLVEW